MNDSIWKKFPDPALIDFGVDGSGTGYRLEKMGGVVLIRPLPSTTASQHQPELWEKAHAVFKESRRGHGTWDFLKPPPDPWHIEIQLPSGSLCLNVRPAPSGQVGIFLEQASQWRWLSEKTKKGSRVLSLFAHSGAATLALAQAGAEVVHVDSSRQSIQLARRNAAASHLDDASIRWICEDAQRFVARERNRGNQYDGFVLDPPSWGHGPKGEAFSIDKHLVPLLADCGQLLSPTDGIISNWPQHSHLHSKQHHPNYYRSPAVHFRAPIFMDESLISAGSLALVALETHRNKMWSIRRLQNCQCFNQ
jgi:23S rRNA (cytosine1962-C5)-methyltransferase